MQTPARRRSSSADGSGSVTYSLTRRFGARSVTDRDEPTMNAKQLLGLFIQRRRKRRLFLRRTNAGSCIEPVRSGARRLVPTSGGIQGDTSRGVA
jgi:hypothetical protein